MKTEMLDVGLPRGLSLERFGTRMRIVRKWFSLKVIPLAIFAMVWDGFLFFWYANALEGGSLITILFPLGHVSVGLGITYYVIAGFLNRTYIDVDRGRIQVRHRPIPYFGNKKLRSRDIKQLYAKEKIGSDNNAGSFEVFVLTKDKKSISLIKGLESDEQALFIEQEIEKYLRLEDVPVKGELNK
jgi:hypothetical protein